MRWLSGTAIAFLLVLTLVIWLARSSTARWERERRAAGAPRLHLPAEAPRPVGTAARLRRVLVRAAGAVPRIDLTPPGRLQGVIGAWTAPRRLVSHVAPVRRALRPVLSAVTGAGIRRRRRTPAPAADAPVQDARAGEEAPVPPRLQRITRGSGGPRRRRPFRFPHRSRRWGDPGAAPADPGEGAGGTVPSGRPGDRPAPS